MMIKQVQMVNCQSWESDSFTLSKDTINVIAADNGTGKSVFFKMLKITACPKFFSRDERKKLIRKGAEFARILFLFYDGALGVTTVYPTRTIYMYRESGSRQWEQFDTPPLKMLKNIGLLVVPNSSFIVNIVDTDQNLLLVDSQARYNYDLLKVLVYCEQLENIKKKMDVEREELSAAHLNLLGNISSLERQLKDCEYVDIVQKKYELDCYQAAVAVMYLLVDCFELLEVFRQNIIFSADYAMLFLCLNSLEQLETIDYACLAVRDASPDMRLVHCLENFERIKKAVGGLLVNVSEPYHFELIGVLERLESVDFRKLTVADQPVPPKLADLLNHLESIHLERLYYGTEPVSVEFITALEQLELLNDWISTSILLAVEICGLSVRIDELSEALRSSGGIYSCEIYGKVVFDGKECVPYSE